MQKSFLSVLLLILLKLTVFAQPSTFVNFYGGKGYDEGIASFPNASGGYTLIGNSSAYNTSTSDIWIIKTDYQGNFISHKTYGSWQYEKACCAIKHKNGNIYIVGTTFQNFIKGYDIYILGIQEDGTEIFQRYLGGSDWDIGVSVEFDSDSTLLILGQTQSYSNDVRKSILLRTNLQGDSLSSAVIPSIFEDFANDVKVWGNNYIIAGYFQNPPSQKMVPFFQILNHNFDTLNRVNYSVPYDCEIKSICVNSDSSFTFGGYYRDTVLGHRENLLLRSKYNGNLLFFNELPQGKDCYIKHVIKNKFGGYLLLGTSNIWTNGQEDFHLSWFSDNGFWVGGGTYGTYKSDIPNQLFQDSTDSYSLLLSGTSSNTQLPQTSFMFVKCDSLFHAVGQSYIVISGIEEQHSSSIVHLYPNPANQKIFVDPVIPVSYARFELLNNNGEIVKSVELQNSENCRIEVSDCPSGLYYLRSITSEKITYSKIIISH